jgi:hypothetical protein
VIRRHQALSGITGRKETRRCFSKSSVKSCSLTVELRKKLQKLRYSGERGIPGGAVKCVDIRRNTNSEGTFLGIT